MRPKAAIMAVLLAVCLPGFLLADGEENNSVPASYRPVQRPSVPVVKGAARSDLDRFVLARLEPLGLGLSPEAGRSTLIRRVSIALTGLPPSLEDVKSYERDHAPGAHGRMVDRFLASPHYGARMGKMWLDAVGYADSNGYFNADSDRPLAWRYRDYVVASFQADKPFDRFVMEQIAGDEMAGYTPGGDVGPAMREALVATHFLRNAPDGTGESDGNPEEVLADRFTVLEGNIQNLANALMGLTIQCARCHDHKFEPITQVEYYRMQAILFPVYNPAKWSKPNDRVVVAGTAREREQWKKANDAVDRLIAKAKEELAEKAAPWRIKVVEEKTASLKEPVRDSLRAAFATPPAQRTKEQAALLKANASLVEINDEALAKRFAPFHADREASRKEISRLEAGRPVPLDKIAAFVENDANPPAHRLLKRGIHTNPGEPVTPGVIAALESPGNRFTMEPPPGGGTSTGRRTALARWVTSPRHPLFARVMVNRIWQHHFGTGLVATADNLGASGAKASHPELLDYLALEFIRSGWSVKAIHRLILGSAVAMQSSELGNGNGTRMIDPDNRLLSRFPLRRIDAEAIRDSMLFVSGELEPAMGGPYVPTQRAGDGTVSVAESTSGARRRSIYLQQRRTQVETFLQLFDAPSIVSTCGKRSTSTVPLQSLALLNSEFAKNRASAFAGRIAREAGESIEGRILMAYRLACARAPNAEELGACVKFIATQAEAYAGMKDSQARAWADLCQMILASNAFLHVE